MQITTTTESRTERVANFFRAHPNEWVIGLALAEIGGAYAWRTRLSEARRLFDLNIRNRQRVVRRDDGSAFIVSEYMFVPLRTLDVRMSTEEDGANVGETASAPLF